MKTARRAGDTIGVYMIIRELGHGGMGTVYEALDTTLDRRIALKIVRSSDLAEDQNQELALQHFKREAKLAARLNHPNVVTVHALNVIDDAILIAMELVQGESLESLIARGRRWRPRTAARLLWKIADGVAAAHDQGIVHGDLKPGNLMITRSGAAKVLDFGVARQFVSEEGIDGPEDTPILGTINYMAPEQITRGPVGPWTDVFALGAIAYEMVSGEPAFGEGEPITVGMRVTSETPPYLDDAELSEQYFGPLAGILKRALAKEPEVRFANARNLARALAVVAAQQRESAKPATPAPPEKPGILRPAMEALRRFRNDRVGPVVQRAKLAVQPSLDNVANALFTNPLVGKWLPPGTLPAPLARRFTALGLAILFTVLITGAAAIARIGTTQTTTVVATPIHVLPSNAEVTVVGPPQHPLLGLRSGAASMPRFDSDSVLLRFSLQGFAPQEHWFTGLPLLVELEQLPQQSCGVVQATPPGTEITTDDPSRQPAATTAVFCVHEDDSLLVTLSSPGYVSESVWFRGPDIRVALATRAVSVRFQSNVPASVSVFTSAARPVVTERSTPFTLAVQPGQYQVRFEADGFPTWDSTYVIRPTSRSVSVERSYPVAATGILRVWVEGGWARVSVDGGTPRLTATTFTDLTVGDHVLELTRPGNTSRIDTVYVRPFNAPDDTTRVGYKADLSRLDPQP